MLAAAALAADSVFRMILIATTVAEVAEVVLISLEIDLDMLTNTLIETAISFKAALVIEIELETVVERVLRADFMMANAIEDVADSV